MEVLTKSAQETKKLGKEIATNLVNRTENREHRVKGREYKKGAVVLALSGELGSGKTTFVQGLAEGLGIKKRIISPTFIMMRKYQVKLQKSKSPKLQAFYHVDLYRLEDNVETEVRNLGIEEIWSSPENIVAIEWAEKIKKIVPQDATWIKFEDLEGNRRRILSDYDTKLLSQSS